MRKSKKYLMSIPVKFIIILTSLFLIFYIGFVFLEHQSGMTSDVHDEMSRFALIMASIIAIDCLVIMVDHYLDTHSTEISLEEYVKKVDEERAKNKIS